MWALRDNNVLVALNTLANQSARYIDHKHKPYNMELPACQHNYLVYDDKRSIITRQIYHLL